LNLNGGWHCTNLKMNTPKASKHKYGSPDRRSENLDLHELALKTEASPLAEIPHRASNMSPMMMDMLARVEGVARWGLNE
jgi:hypothetical protein